MEAVDRGSELINEIGRRLVADEPYASIDWNAFALVVTVTPTRKDMSGFAYLDDGSTIPALPDDLNLGTAFDELNALTARPDGKRWMAMLLQCTRANGHLRFLFEWDDVDRWAVTPANLATRREELRPLE